MNTPFFSRLPKWLVWTSQAFLGLVFLFSATVKGIDPLGTSIKVGEYLSSFGITVHDIWHTVLAFVLIDFEFFLGLVLFTGLWRKAATATLVVFMFPLTLLTLYIAIANPVADCGCFGDALKISNTATFWKNIFLFALAIIVFSSPQKMYRMIPDRWGLVLLIVGFVLTNHGFIREHRYHLPVIDFRPYTVGSDLYTLTRAGQDGTYDYRFVYEKDGKERVFTMDELAEVDSTWTYVRDETVELTAPVDPAGADFVLLDREGTPVTERFFGEEANAVLFFNTNLYRTRTPGAREIVQKIHEIGAKVYLVMSNSFEDIEAGEFGDITVPFDETFYLDRSTSLTFVRSHPDAVVVIGGGKIVRKNSLHDFFKFMDSPLFPSDLFNPDPDLHLHRNLFFGFMGLGFLLLFGFGLYFKRRQPSDFSTTK